MRINPILHLPPSTLLTLFTRRKIIPPTNIRNGTYTATLTNYKNAKQQLARATYKRHAQEGQHVQSDKQTIKKLKEEIASYETSIKELERRIPNLIAETCPEEVEVIRTKNAKETYHTNDHLTLLTARDMLDFVTAAKTTGARFYFLKNQAVMLELALIQYAIKICEKRGFTMTIPPSVVRTQVAEACGYQPRGLNADGEIKKIEDDSFRIQNTDWVMCGTAELPLTAMKMDEIIPLKELPHKVSGIGRAYRMEAGHRGKVNKGLYRVHEFTKVEMVATTAPEDSDRVFREMVECSYEILDGLDLHYRVINMPPDELGNPAFYKYDIEAWMPGRNEFGEVASISNCTDYQSQGLNIRYKGAESNEYVHTLNGTALAVPRVIIALAEQHQLADGRISLPSPLRDLLGSEYL